MEIQMRLIRAKTGHKKEYLDKYEKANLANCNQDQSKSFYFTVLETVDLMKNIGILLK